LEFFVCESLYCNIIALPIIDAPAQKKTNFNYSDFTLMSMKCRVVAVAFSSGEGNAEDKAWTVDCLYKGIKGSLS
jgi:hypothetical protein